MSVNRRELLQAGLALSTLSVLNRRAVADNEVPHYRRIAVEEAFACPEYNAARDRVDSRTTIGVSTDAFKPFYEMLFDVGENRLAAMDADGISIQVLSFAAPGVQVLPTELAVEMAQEANNHLADVIRKFPRRFAGMITVAPQDPERAALEIERAATQLGLTGILINSHTNGEFLDDPKFTPIFEAITAHDLTFYLHPAAPPPQAAEFLRIPGFTVGWGYGVEAGTHAIRLIASGLFDRFPDLRLVLGHMGEGLPLWIDRLDNRYQWEVKLTGKRKLEKLPGDYIRENIYVTTSGMNYHAQLRMALEVMGPEHVLFATDYPMESMREAVDAIDSAELTEAERASVYYRNAERLFRIPSAPAS